MEDLVSVIRDVESVKHEHLKDGMRVKERLDELGRGVDVLRDSVAAVTDGLAEVVNKAIVDCSKDFTHPLCAIIDARSRDRATEIVSSALSNEDSERRKHGHLTPAEALDCPTCGGKFVEAVSQRPGVVRDILKKALATDPDATCEVLGNCGFDKRSPPKPKSVF